MLDLRERTNHRGWILSPRSCLFLGLFASSILAAPETALSETFTFRFSLAEIRDEDGRHDIIDRLDRAARHFCRSEASPWHHSDYRQCRKQLMDETITAIDNILQRSDDREL